MDVDTNLMSIIHKEQRRRKHKRAQSDRSASPMDWSSCDPSQMEDADLLVIPDTPSPVFNGRKTKVKLTGKIKSSVSAPDIYENRVSNGYSEDGPSLSPDFAARNLKSDAPSEAAGFKLSTTSTRHTDSWSKSPMEMVEIIDHNSPFYDAEKQPKPTNENSANYYLSPDGVASDASPEIDYHHGIVRLKDASPEKVESTLMLRKQRSCENGMANMDDVASEPLPEIDYHHGSTRLKDASPKKVESTYRLKKHRLHEKTIDITNGNELVDSDSTDVYCVEDPSDVLILSSEATGSSESAICGSECPRNDSGSNHTVSHKHSPKKRLFQNGIRKREFLETDTLHSAIVSESMSSHDRHRLFQKQRTAGECSQLKRCIRGDGHSKSSKHEAAAPSFCRFTDRTEVVPFSMQSGITSPPSGLSEKSFLRRKRHMKPHHGKHNSGIGTSSMSANCDSLSPAGGRTNILPCKGKRHTSRHTDDMTCFPSFAPASSLIDLTKTPVHVPEHEMRSWRSPAFHVTSNFTSRTRRHKHSHRKDHSREKRNSDGSDAKMANVLSQLEQDEAMARRLQEEMDRDFALTLVESENRTMADSSTFPSDLPRDLAGLDQVISDLEMSASSVIDYGPIHLRSRGAHTCVSVTDTGAVVSVGFTANSRPPCGGRRRGGRHRHRVVEYYEPEQNDGNDYEFLLGLAEHIGDATVGVGLCRQHIDLLPQRLYGGPQTGRDISCNICMCDYEAGDNLRMLPCFHEFHQSCIDTWIQKNATCPICRVDIEVGQS